jgi:hypothetical protein
MNNFVTTAVALGALSPSIFTSPAWARVAESEERIGDRGQSVHEFWPEHATAEDRRFDLRR